MINSDTILPLGKYLSTLLSILNLLIIRIFINLESILPLTYLLGDDDVHQLAKIFNILGTPREEDWPDVELLPNYVEFEKCDPISLQPLICPQTFLSSQQSIEEANSRLDLLMKMLELNPNKRITAKEVIPSHFEYCSQEYSFLNGT